LLPVSGVDAARMKHLAIATAHTTNHRPTAADINVTRQVASSD